MDKVHLFINKINIKTKLKLSNIKVKSVITSIEEKDKETIYGQRNMEFSWITITTPSGPTSPAETPCRPTIV